MMIEEGQMRPELNPDAGIGEVLYSVVIKGGGMWSKVVGRGRTLRLTDIGGGANAGALFYNADNLAERYNMPDTLKGQHIFYLTHPWCLHGDMGRIFCSITADTCGWHDTVCGCGDRELVTDRYGTEGYQEVRNDFPRNGRDCFLIELGKWGLGKRDLVPNVNFFSKVVPDENGALSYVAGNSRAGSTVDLRMEMDTLVVLNTCPHPLDMSETYAPKPIRLDVLRTAAATADDPCRLSCPENGRAMENNAIYYSLRD